MKKPHAHTFVHTHPYNEHAVLIFLQFSEGKLESERAVNAIFDLQELLSEEIEGNGVGLFDGNEFFEDTVTFFIYGPDANAIYEVIQPVISGLPVLPGSYIVKRYGDIGAPEEQIPLI